MNKSLISMGLLKRLVSLLEQCIDVVLSNICEQYTTLQGILLSVHVLVVDELQRLAGVGSPTG